MAKKQNRVITVANPKIGKNYQFIHGGFTLKIGKLISESEDLTKHYGHKWYKFEVQTSSRKMYYPASCFDIIKEIK